MPRKRKQIASTEDATIQEPPSKKVATESTPSIEPIILPIATQTTSSSPTPTSPPITNLKKFQFTDKVFRSICGTDRARFDRGMEIFRCGGPIPTTCKLIPTNTTTPSSSSTYSLKFEGKVPGSHRLFYRCSIICNQLGIKKREDITSWHCNCPDWGNPCKHLIAFCCYLSVNGKNISVRQPIQQQLETMSKEELVKMIQYLCLNNDNVERAVSSYINGEEDEDEEDEDAEEEEDYYGYRSRYY